MLTSSPSVPTPSSARLSSLRRKKPSHHTRRPPPSRSISMFSSLKSLVTSPFSWFANDTTDSFESEDTPGKRKLVHNLSNPYENEGDQQGIPSAYRAKRIRLDSPERVATPPVSRPGPRPYLDPPTPAFQPSTHSRTHAPKPARPYVPSNNNNDIPIPLPDTSRLNSLSFRLAPRTQTAPTARTMSMDPPKATRPSAQELSLVVPISRHVSMEYSPSPTAQPANPPFRMRSALTPQPGAPLYGPNPQRRERNPSEPPPLTTLIENPIFVKPPPPPPEQRRVSDDSSPVTLGSLVGAQKSVSLPPSQMPYSPAYHLRQGLPANRSHSTLVLPNQSPDGKRPFLFPYSLSHSF
jgi:nucleoporin NUP1